MNQREHRRMWMDDVITDGEYRRIMDKLNEKWGMRMNTWIKPSERLPENADRVLVIRKGFNGKYYWVVIAQYLYRLKAWFDDDGQPIEVIGWKSLPDLPKELVI